MSYSQAIGAPPAYPLYPGPVYPLVPVSAPVAAGPAPAPPAPPAPPAVPAPPAQPAPVAPVATSWTDRVAGWWRSRSTTEKVAIGAASAATIGALLWVWMKKPKRLRPNLRAATQRKLRGKKPGGRVKVAGKTYKVGKIKTIKGGRRFGHQLPPKKYRTKGARRPSDYAWPEGYKYPLFFRSASGRIKPEVSRAHTRSAASYYARNRHLYPATVRRTIARNINRAKAQLGIGGKPAKP